MFESLFFYSSVVRRHREGPMAGDRVAYLRSLSVRGMARGTILRHARYCLCVAECLEPYAQTKPLTSQEVAELSHRWAAERVTCGRATTPRWPAENFRSVAEEFLRSCGRLQETLALPAQLYEDKLAEFITARQQSHWYSNVTCNSALWQIRRFLDYIQQRNISLCDVSPTDVDGYYQHVALRWNRASLHTSAKILRSWFTYCEGQRWVRVGLAQALLLPRLYRHEGLPIGPSWEEVVRMLNETMGPSAAARRDHAILLLLSVYGLRSAELRRLQIDDIDWVAEKIRVIRSKSGRQESLPLDPQVGNALVNYLRHGRPKCPCREIFLTLCAPHRPLSGGGLYHVVHHHLAKVSSLGKGRGPHALRHACAQHLLEMGRSIKEVGDHLGHRSPDATRFYVKVGLSSLRRVAFEDLGGLG